MDSSGSEQGQAEENTSETLMNFRVSYEYNRRKMLAYQEWPHAVSYTHPTYCCQTKRLLRDNEGLPPLVLERSALAFAHYAKDNSRDTNQ
jgi:hypothetical protein